jgi:serine/threonine protein kinase
MSSLSLSCIIFTLIFFSYIGTELCQDTLENLVNKKYEGQDVGSKLEILKQITQGLEYLHSNDVVHRDIKPQNILISFPHGSVPPLMKLTDFGISRIHKEGRSDLTKTGSSGTLGWIAPEFYDPKVEKYTRLADIFPLGCVFCYVLSDGKHPFGDEKDLRQGNIKSGRYYLPMEDLEKYDHAFELIEAMLDPNPEKRPTASEVLAHPFFQSLRSDESTAAIASLTTSGKIKEISQLFEKQLKAKAVLGKGSFNTIVCKAPYNESMRAIKRIEKVFNDSYINEIELLSSDELNNTHVVRYFNHEDDELYW